MSLDTHVLHRAARAAVPAYTELCEQVRNAPVVTPDETGWRIGGERHWLWVFTTPDTTVYAICPGRGFDDAATVLGTDYAGVLVRDGWAPYRCYNGLHQTCLNQYADVRIYADIDADAAAASGVCVKVIGIIRGLRERRGAHRVADNGRRGRVRGWSSRARVLSAPSRHGCRRRSC